MPPNPETFLLVSLPTSISPSDDRDEALTALRSAVTTDYGTVFPFTIPDFKIGSLDALVQQADELAKVAAGCEGVVGKVGDCLKTILESNEDKIAEQKTVNGKQTDRYLTTFQWNSVKYRVDKPIGDIVSQLQKEITSIDNDVKNKYNQYNQAKTNLTTLQKRQTGYLNTRSLNSVVDPKQLVQNSEYLESHLIAVPKQLLKEFLSSYESISPMVVPRSAQKLDNDEEFTLFAVTTFKKHGSTFVQKCRERKWTPRDFEVKKDAQKQEQADVGKATEDERRLWRESLRLASTGWGEAVMAWIHILAMRVFIESVLRYGLPLRYTCGLVKTTAKLVKRVRGSLDESYSYLGGNAFGRDKKGRVKKDESSTSADMQAAGHAGSGGGDYSAYVCYEFEI